MTVTRVDGLAGSTFDPFGIVKRISRRLGAISFTGGAVGQHRVPWKRPIHPSLRPILR
jgi:hypothetical protein